jgi:hypothetical protein
MKYLTIICCTSIHTFTSKTNQYAIFICCRRKPFKKCTYLHWHGLPVFLSALWVSMGFTVVLKAWRETPALKSCFYHCYLLSPLQVFRFNCRTNLCPHFVCLQKGKL